MKGVLSEKSGGYDTTWLTSIRSKAAVHKRLTYTDLNAIISRRKENARMSDHLRGTGKDARFRNSL